MVLANPSRIQSCTLTYNIHQASSFFSCLGAPKATRSHTQCFQGQSHLTRNEWQRLHVTMPKYRIALPQTPQKNKVSVQRDLMPAFCRVLGKLSSW